MFVCRYVRTYVAYTPISPVSAVGNHKVKVSPTVLEMMHIYSIANKQGDELIVLVKHMKYS